MKIRKLSTRSKILIIGLVTTIFRIGCQLLLPASDQTILKPSIFVTSQTLPIAFSILAVISYSIFAYLFVLMIDKKDGVSKNRPGLKYSFALCFLWSTYLFEPLPHATSILQDSVAYAVIDSLALLLMGLGLDFFFRKEASPKMLIERKPTNISLINIIVPTLLFLCLYTIFGVYSYFEERSVLTILWCLVTGAISSGVVLYLTNFAHTNKTSRNPLFFGTLVYAINLIFFNGFMLLVFDFNPIDLSLRTFVDILAISSGLLLFDTLRRKSK